MTRLSVFIIVLVVGLPVISRGDPEEPREAVVILPLQGSLESADRIALVNDLVEIAIADLGIFKIITIADVNAQLGFERVKESVGCDQVLCAAEIGGALGVRYLMHGTVRPLGSQLVLKLTIIDTVQQEAFGRGSSKFANQESKLDEGVRTAVAKILQPTTQMSALSASCGTPEACHDLGLMYRSGNGQPRDYKTALSLFDANCEKGYGSSCYEAALMYRTGLGTIASRKRAVTLLTRACDLNDGAGCNELAVAHARGDLVKRNVREAIQIYRRGCRLQHAPACASYANYLYSGRGVEQDQDEAARLFRFACSKGHAFACARRKELDIP